MLLGTAKCKFWYWVQIIQKGIKHFLQRKCESWGGTTGADPGFCQGGGLAGPKNFSRRSAPRKIFGTLLGGSGGMLPHKVFKIESARLP